tara:strand:+ start:31 stop:483 length:453 start_codon:yes stop_codon:yes gene_type:complete
MDVTNWDLDAIPEEEELKEGRHIMEYHDAEVIGNDNGWQAIKVTFKIKDSGNFVGCTFTMQANNPKAVEIGKGSFNALVKAAGLTAMKDTEELKGKFISAEVGFNDNGYPEIKDNFGKTWQAVEKTKSSSKPKVEEEEESSGIVDDEIPF